MAVFLLIFGLMFSFGCSTLPGMKEPTDADINAKAAQAYQEIKTKAKRSTHMSWTRMVERVAQRIALASKENFQWEVLLIESPEVNAWCMPGGKMAVYTGIMPILKTEAALAAVLGHEVAHATLHHGRQRYSRAIKGNMAGLIVGGATAVGGQILCKNDSKCKILTGLAGAAAGFAITFFDRQFSRQDESEADRQGQIYMAQAGYDPSEAIHLWERMSSAHSGQTPPEWLSTHPSESRRRTHLKAWLPKAHAEYEQAQHQFGLGENIP